MPIKKLKILKQEVYESIFKEDPHWFALSFSIGILFGFIPLFGFQLIPLLFITFLFDLNKVAVLSRQLFMNILTFPFVYLFCFIVGVNIMGQDLGFIFNAKELTLEFFLRNAWTLFKPLLVGLAVVGMIATVASYFIVKYLVIYYQEKNKPGK